MTKKTYYCPRGCEVFRTASEDPDCGACGNIMTTDSARYDAVHDEIEARGIAACEPKVLQDERGYFIGMDYRRIYRLSVEYWRTKEAAGNALTHHRWTERHPKSDEWKWGD